MRLACGDILAEQLAVDIDRDVDLRHNVGGLVGEPTAPHLVAHVLLAGNPGLTLQMTDQPRKPFAGNRRLQIVVAIAAIVVVAGALYGIAPFKRNAGDPACNAALVKAKQISPLIHGEIAGLQAASEGLKLPN